MGGTYWDACLCSFFFLFRPLFSWALPPDFCFDIFEALSLAVLLCPAGLVPRSYCISLSAFLLAGSDIAFSLHPFNTTGLWTYGQHCWSSLSGFLGTEGNPLTVGWRQNCFVHCQGRHTWLSTWLCVSWSIHEILKCFTERDWRNEQETALHVWVQGETDKVLRGVC